MARSPIVGSRELKTRLGTYLNRVRRGETILVTDRNEPVAELRPVPGASDAKLARRRTAAAAGGVTVAGGPPPARFTPSGPPGKLGSGARPSDRVEPGTCASLTRAPSRRA